MALYNEKVIKHFTDPHNVGEFEILMGKVLMAALFVEI